MTDTQRIKKKGIYLTALGLAVPMMIQNGITNAVGLVDNIMVGSLGTESITAVSIAVQLIFVFALAVFGGISGPAIYVSQYHGSGNVEGVRSVFRLKIWIVAAVLVVGSIILFTWGDELVLLYLQGESDTIDAELTLSLCREYLQIMIVGMIPYGLTQVYASTLRETGDSVKPMVAGVCSVVGDIVFNYLLIFGKFGFPEMGVRGAAVATVIGRTFELAVIVIWSHLKRNKHIFLKGIYKTLMLPRKILFPIIKKGLPIFINEFMWAGGLAVLTQIYSTRGLDIVAGLNISNAICNLLNVSFVALGGAVGIQVGHMLGAGDEEGAKSASTRLMWFTAAISTGVMGVLIAVSGIFPELYNTSDVVKDYSTWFIIITAVSFPVQGALNSLYFTLRSGGKTVITFLFDAVFNWVISIPLAYVLCNFTDFDILIVYGCVLFMDFVKALIGYVLVRKGIWITNLVSEEV